MKLHILGIAGTFMGGVAALARELGHEVEGSDQAVYPPMSTQLEQLGIALKQGYKPEYIAADCDEIVVGNALSRGNAAVEQVIDDGRRYTSGAQWLSENLLPGRDTIAVAGTHGKTTTTTILTYLLQAAGREPGFLIGGVAEDFGVSARVGRGREFVVEADEYDTAFFDKRSKFVHYRPLVAILNNLEYDHADIFPDVAAIQRQFHHLVRTVPRRGRLIVNGEDEPPGRSAGDGVLDAGGNLRPGCQPAAAGDATRNPRRPRRRAGRRARRIRLDRAPDQRGRQRVLASCTTASKSARCTGRCSAGTT